MKKALFKRKIKQARTAFEFDQKDQVKVDFDFEQAEDLMENQVTLFDQDKKPRFKKFQPKNKIIPGDDDFLKKYEAKKKDEDTIFDDQNVEVIQSGKL